MVKLNNYSLNLGYPVYGAQFVNNHTLIVAGGGGDGNNGIPNKMTAILIQPENSKKPIKRYRELTLNPNEDSVMSLAVGNGTILAGINENPIMMSKGINKHLRKFKFENDHLKFVESCQIHPNTNANIYQKITAISTDGSIGVIVMSDTPSSIYIVETSKDIEEKFKIVTEGDVKDVTISLDGKLMCYITTSVFEVISLVTGRSVYKKNLDFLMSKIRFLDNNEVIISGSNKKDAIIAKFSIANSKIIQKKVIFKNLKGITSMDVNIKNNLTVLATSSYSLIIIRTSDLKIIKILNKVHDFAITKVVFSDDGKYLASCSAANTVNVVEIPNNFSTSKSILATIFQYIFSIIIIALLSVGTQYLYENGYIHIMINKAIEKYETFKPQDSSKYFTVESISSYTPTMSIKSSKSISTSGLSYSSRETPIEEISSLSSSVLSSTLQKTSTILNENVQASVSPTPSVISSDNDPHTSILTSNSEIAERTIKDDIISSEDFTTTDYAISNSQTIKEKADSEVPEIEVTEEKTFSSISTSLSTLSSSLFPTQLVEQTTFKEITKEIVKEIVREVTSVVVSTEVSIETSTSLITSVETSVSTETSVAVSTSVVVVTVTQNPISHIETVDHPKHRAVHLEAIKDDAGKEEVVVVNDENHTVETLDNSDVHPTTDSVEIQIEPTSQVYDDPIQASIDQENNVKSELEQTTSDYSIQIEPSSSVFENPSEAAQNEQKLVEEELNAINAESEVDNSVPTSVDIEIKPITPIMMLQADGPATTETSAETPIQTEAENSNSSPAIDIKPITPITMLQADGPDVSSTSISTGEPSESMTEKSTESTSSPVEIKPITPIMMLQADGPETTIEEIIAETKSVVKDEL